MMIEQLLDEQQQPLVEIKDVSVAFENQNILQDINLKIPAGETLVLLGESGCGKTVLMKTIIGLVLVMGLYLLVWSGVICAALG